jgi:hypothetical protein
MPSLACDPPTLAARCPLFWIESVIGEVADGATILQFATRLSHRTSSSICAIFVTVALSLQNALTSADFRFGILPVYNRMGDE